MGNQGGRGLIARILRAVASMRVGLVLFGLVAAAGIGGSASAAAGEKVYGSWWFAALLAALALDTALCAFTRFPGLAPRRRDSSLRGISVYLIHLSIVLVAAASLWASLAFTTVEVAIAEGESFEAGGRSLRLESFRIERYPDGSPSDYLSLLEVGGARAEVRVNRPLRLGATKLIQAGYGRLYAVKIVGPATGEERLVQVEAGAVLPLAEGGSVGFSVEPAAGYAGSAPAGTAAGGAATADGAVSGEAAPRVELAIFREGRALERGSWPEGEPVALGDTGIELVVQGERAYSRFIVRTTPGLGFLWASLALLALSSCGLVLWPRKAPSSDSSGGKDR